MSKIDVSQFREHLQAEKTAVVLDIGSVYTKCGIAGEHYPRVVMKSIAKNGKGKLVRLNDHLHSDDFYQIMKNFLLDIYNRALLVNPKEWKVVVVESILCPTRFRETLAKLLFKYFEVPCVLFAPSHLTSTFTLGIATALVLEVGYEETLAVPIAEGIPLSPYCESVALAAKSVYKELEKKLLITCSVTGPDGEMPLSAVMTSIPEDTLEDIAIRCCFVTDKKRAKILQAQEQAGQDMDASSLVPVTSGVKYPLSANHNLLISGNVREFSCEVLFKLDAEESSVATAVLEVLKKVPIDLRKPLAENIVIMGGTTMLPGFKHRLMCEIYDLLNLPKYCNAIGITKVKFHKLPSKENFAPWLGGSIFGALEILPNRAMSRENYLEKQALPDWTKFDVQKEGS